MTSIDPKGLNGFRPEQRRSTDPDETEGRMIYRAKSDTEACRQVAMTRSVRYVAAPTQGGGE